MRFFGRKARQIKSLQSQLWFAEDEIQWLRRLLEDERNCRIRTFEEFSSELRTERLAKLPYWLNTEWRGEARRNGKTEQAVVSGQIAEEVYTKEMLAIQKEQMYDDYLHLVAWQNSP